MATLHFPSEPNAEVIQAEFVTLTGRRRLLRLLVDSGFTGVSDVVLDESMRDLIRIPVGTALASGALQGRHDRAFVNCRIPGSSFQQMLVAILGSMSHLALPTGVRGMVGLTFLRRFALWGAERGSDGCWQFFLSENEPVA